jgi:crotonobetainyl-CoA:carnitine CoA-transferase CaiB-like acyl-CoA transferase
MGKGSYVSVSLLDAAVSSLVNQATNWLMNGHIPQRIGSLHPNIAPYGEMVTSSDGKQIVLAVGSQQQFASLCKVFHLDELIEDERFNSNQNRVVHRLELNELLIKKAGLYASNELMNLFLENAVPAGIIKNMEEVFEDENAKSSILTDKMNDGKEAKRVAQVAFKLS